MYVKYGDFQFASGEATISSVDISTNLSPRGFMVSRTLRMDIEGEVCITSGNNSEITARLLAIETAFSEHGRDLGLYHSNGDPTVHILESNHVNNLTGNQVLDTRYPGAYGGEYVDGRMFSIVVGCEMRADETPLLHYHDSVRQFGNGGPDVRWSVHPRFRRWVADEVAPATKVMYEHTGQAETLGAWFEPPPPYFTSPLFLKSASVLTGREHPKRRPQGYLGRITTWRYVYELPSVDLTIFPVLR